MSRKRERTMADVRMLVLSDLHAYDERFLVAAGASAPMSSPGKPSWLDYSDRQGIDTDPILSLLQLISNKHIRAEFLVVPGDICDKANGDALRQAWSELERIRTTIGARATIATAGNHDLDSRYRANAYDAKEALLTLAPNFPVVEPIARAEFWGYAVSQTTLGDTRFVVVNSCAHHGGATNEIYHGRISPIALNKVKEILAAPTSATIHVLVCHHHPYPFPGDMGGPDDRMYDGETLLDALDQSEYDWLVIHGHRHMARLLYSGGSTNSPVVLAAGSMSVRLSPHLTTRTRNQAHLVTIRGSTSGELRGNVESWNYTPYVGWATATDDAGLPHQCGFGYRGSVRELASKALIHVREHGGPMTWRDLMVRCPDLAYLTPRDFDRFKKSALRVGLAFVPSADGSIEAAETNAA